MEDFIIKSISINEWDKILSTCNDATFFHTSVWIKLLEITYFYKPYLIMIELNGQPSVLIPFLEVNTFIKGRKGVSLPFSDYCPPIILNRSFKEEELIEAIEYFKAIHNWKKIEIRGGYFHTIAPAEIFIHHCLDLSADQQVLYEQLKPSNKRNIKNARLHGIRIVQSRSLNSMKQFYRLNCITRKKHGLPPQPFSFFMNVLKNILSVGHGSLFLAKYKTKIIAASLFLHFKDSVIYKYGASDHKYQHLRANNLLMWEAIAWYKSHGYIYFSFGRTDRDHQGLIDFKDSWGSVRKEIHYYDFSNQKKAQPWHMKKPIAFLFTNLPIIVLRFIGLLFYRFMG